MLIFVSFSQSGARVVALKENLGADGIWWRIEDLASPDRPQHTRFCIIDVIYDFYNVIFKVIFTNGSPVNGCLVFLLFEFLKFNLDLS